MGTKDQQVLNSRVDLYYYAHSNTIKSIAGTILNLTDGWVMITDDRGKVRAFPASSIQQLIVNGPEDQS